MHEAGEILQDATTIAFVLLGLAVTVDWILHRERRHGWLALALGSLGLVTLAGRIPQALGYSPPWLSALSIVGFMLSGYSLLRFRGTFLPLGRRTHLAVLAAIAGVVVLFLAAGVPPAGTRPTALQGAATLLLVLVWCGSVLEPALRFWLAARRRPAVQKARLRALSAGFGGIALILVVAVGVGQAAQSTWFQLLIQLVALATVPLLYVSFSPPGWLRRLWRSPEEDALNSAMQELLVSSPERDVVAAHSLEWAMRLVGAEGGCLFDGRHRPIALRGLALDQAGPLWQELGALDASRSRQLPGRPSQPVILLPLALTEGRGALLLLGGPFTPVFGNDEMVRVERYALSATAALDRASLIEQLKQANLELERASRHKSVFLANMSHELRTPLNAILGFSELLLDEAPDSFDQATRKNFLEQINSSGKHLLGLINDILDLSKVEAGQMDLRPQRMRVDEVAGQVLSTVEPLAGQKGIQLTADVAPELELVADPGKVKQMLLNLVSNAIKFTPDGGQVTVAARARDGVVELRVSDTGIGIAPEDIGKLFEEFQQLDSGPGRQHQGTGLGLALTRRFAELHGGRIEVESEVGKGSTFIVVLPAEQPLPETPAAPVAEPTPSVAREKRPLVLVVEDNAQAADLLVRYLDRGGYRAVVARDGGEALEMTQRLRPVAITLDILLPELDGWEVLNALKRDQLTRHIPVVVVSVVDLPDLGRALGALDYFVKPVDARTLLARLDQLTLTSRAKTGETRVLIVDDEQADRQRLARLLRPSGFKVLTAGGGAEGLELVRKRHPDLVLLDLMMPEVNGFEVVAAMKADPGMRAIPILIVTAKDLTDADKELLNGHVAAILRKDSLAGTDLLNWLRHVVNGKAAAAAPAKVAM